MLHFKEEIYGEGGKHHHSDAAEKSEDESVDGLPPEIASPAEEGEESDETADREEADESKVASSCEVYRVGVNVALNVERVISHPDHDHDELYDKNHAAADSQIEIKLRGISEEIVKRLHFRLLMLLSCIHKI